MRSCGKQAVKRTITAAPTMVPIIRNQPLRIEAPSCGWHTIAAVPPAQYGLSSSSQNATNRARHTEAHSRMAKSSGGPAVASASGRIQLNRNDAALACIVAAHYANGPCTGDRLIDRDRACQPDSRTPEIIGEWTAYSLTNLLPIG